MKHYNHSKQLPLIELQAGDPCTGFHYEPVDTLSKGFVFMEVEHDQNTTHP